MTAPAPTIINYKVLEKNTLKGFFDVELASGLLICGCTLHEKNGKFWIGMPAKPYEKHDGSQSWTKIVDFRDKATSDQFQQMVTPLAAEALERAKAEVAA